MYVALSIPPYTDVAQAALETIQLRVAPDASIMHYLRALPEIRNIAFKGVTLAGVGTLPSTLEHFASDDASPTSEGLLAVMSRTQRPFYINPHDLMLNAALSRLRNIHIENASGWSDYNVTALESLPGLQELTLQRCNFLPQKAVARVRLVIFTHMQLNLVFLSYPLIDRHA